MRSEEQAGAAAGGGVPAADGTVSTVSTDQAVEERRGAERVDVAFQLTFRFGSPLVPASTGTVIDLSTTGLFVRTLRGLKASTRMAGVLRDDPDRVPDGGIDFVGEVAWSPPWRQEGPKGPGFGVRFVHMSPADHTALRRLVDTRR